MKTIAVLTDFSLRATNAAKYALHIAMQLKANVLLHHNFLVPSMEPLASQMTWPIEDYEEIKKDIDQQLNQLAAQLSLAFAELSAGAFRPVIHCSSGTAMMAFKPGEPLTNKDIIMIVAGNHHKGLSALIMGNHLQDVLDQAILPVLVVPEQTEFKSVKKIAFLTDLDHTDLEVINSLTGLARPFRAEIELVHICPEITEAKKKADNFLHEVTNKINYPHIYYRNVCETQVNKGIAELRKIDEADLFVMVHRSKSFLNRIFNNSFTHQAVANTHVPLLVYPYPVSSQPVF